ncbi:unnamed protein product, partial [Gulo gulo]
FLLLSVSWPFFEGFGNQGKGRRYHFNLHLSVLNGQFHSNPQTLSITGCLGHVITNRFWRQTPSADLWGESRCGTKFPKGASQAHNFDLFVVEIRPHGRGDWCRMNLDSGQRKIAAPPCPLSQKSKASLPFLLSCFIVTGCWI